MMGLWGSETMRLIGSRRWLAVLPAFALAAVMNLATLYQHQVNIWDGVFGTLGDWLFFRFILLLLFIFLTADTVIRDINSGWSWLTLARTEGRVRWWTAKVASLFTAALLYFLLGLIIVFLVSAYRLPYAASFSQYATGLSSFSQGLGPLRFPETANPLILSGQLVLYSAFAVTIFVLIPVTISMVIRKAYVASLIPFAWVFLSHFAQTNRLWFSLDLIPKLFFGCFHSPRSALLIQYSTSLLYLVLVGSACYYADVYVVRRTDF